MDLYGYPIWSPLIGVVLAATGLALVAWLGHRLLRWARSGSTSAHALGAVLTEVTQGAVVREAKQGKKRVEGETGDPPKDE
jgi:hypothetical protein